MAALSPSAVPASELTIVGLTAFLTVVDLFATQALLPALSAHYRVSPAAMGLAANACTLGMAIGGLTIAFGGDRLDRRTGILASLVLLSLPTFLLAYAPTLAAFAALRVMQGLCMASAFGLTLGHLGEKFTAESAASAFAAYITGNVASNLFGRLIATTIVDHAGLAANFFVFAAMNLAGAALVFATIERSKKPERASVDPTSRTRSSLSHFRRPELCAGFAIGFCILFAFIGTFTYVNFILVAPPLAVGMMGLGLVYFIFLPSIFTTPLAGRIANRFGFKPALWSALAVAIAGLPMLVAGNLPTVLAGMALVAAGTFFAQALATGFVSRAATSNRAAANGIYLASYFSGGLVGTAILGQIFDSFGWAACVAGVGAALIAAAWLTTSLNIAPGSAMVGAT